MIDFKTQMKRILNENLFFNYPMKNLTTFGVGGCCDYFCIVTTFQKLRKVVDLCRKASKKTFVIGSGSNVLVSDKGFSGVVIKLSGEFEKISKNHNIVTAGAGVKLLNLLSFLNMESLSGLEWSVGIPGTVGGAVYMNAGAFGSEMKDIVESVRIFEKGHIREMKAKKLGFSYRKSIFFHKKAIILEVRMKFLTSSKTKILNLIKDNISKKSISQPLKEKSAGSVFRREKDFFPAKVIDELNLKGVRVGDAEISKIHSGFIVNLGSSSCQEILNLIFYIKQVVKDKTGKELHEEIIILGED